MQAGNGKVFECLLENKHDSRMDPKCVDMLGIREQLMGQDARIAHPLIDACHADIDKYQCGKAAEAKGDHFYLSFLILCLENAEHAGGADTANNNVKSAGGLQAACRHEVQTFRQLLLSDYQLNPEVVLSCAKDIQQYCGGQLQQHGNTMHCLMGVAAQGRKQQPPRTLNAQCFAAVSQTVALANPNDDAQGGVHIDRVLYDACTSVINTKCSSPGSSQFNLLTCLMQVWLTFSSHSQL